MVEFWSRHFVSLKYAHPMFAQVTSLITFKEEVQWTRRETTICRDEETIEEVLVVRCSKRSLDVFVESTRIEKKIVNDVDDEETMSEMTLFIRWCSVRDGRSRVRKEKDILRGMRQQTTRILSRSGWRWFAWNLALLVGGRRKRRMTLIVEESNRSHCFVTSITLQTERDRRNRRRRTNISRERFSIIESIVKRVTLSSIEWIQVQVSPSSLLSSLTHLVPSRTIRSIFNRNRRRSPKQHNACRHRRSKMMLSSVSHGSTNSLLLLCFLHLHPCIFLFVLDLFAKNEQLVSVFNWIRSRHLVRWSKHLLRDWISIQQERQKNNLRFDQTARLIDCCKRRLSMLICCWSEVEIVGESLDDMTSRRSHIGRVRRKQEWFHFHHFESRTTVATICRDEEPFEEEKVLAMNEGTIEEVFVESLRIKRDIWQPATKTLSRSRWSSLRAARVFLIDSIL